MSRSTIVSLNNVNIATYVDGRKDRPWIVLSNSLGATHAMWEPQLLFLTKHYRVLRYDTRGHGDSSTPPGPYLIEDLVRDILGVLDHHKVSRADMLGLSLGGTTMMSLAINYPDRVNELVVCDASAETEPADLERWDRRITQVMSQGTSSLGSELLDRWYTREFRQSREDIMSWSLQMLATVSANGYAGCASALKNVSLVPGLRELQRRLIYVSGAQDGQNPLKMSRLAQITPQASFRSIDPGAHFPNVENPELFNAALSALTQWSEPLGSEQRGASTTQPAG